MSIAELRQMSRDRGKGGSKETPDNKADSPIPDTLDNRGYLSDDRANPRLAGAGVHQLQPVEAPDFVGLASFQRMLTDTRLHKALVVTFTYVIVSVPLQQAASPSAGGASGPWYARTRLLSVCILLAKHARDFGCNSVSLAFDFRG